MSQGNPKGNPGNKGGGRKSAYQERVDAEWHEKVWKDQQDVDALIDKVRSRKYAGRDIAALKLLQGDKYLIGKFMDKLVPDLPQDVNVKGSLAIEISEVIARKNKLKDAEGVHDTDTSTE